MVKPVIKCPNCGSTDLECLSGSAHPLQWYCNWCPWKAWNSENVKVEKDMVMHGVKEELFVVVYRNRPGYAGMDAFATKAGWTNDLAEAKHFNLQSEAVEHAISNPLAFDGLLIAFMPAAVHHLNVIPAKVNYQIGSPVR